MNNILGFLHHLAFRDPKGGLGNGDGKIVDLDINEALDMQRVFDEDLYKIAMTISI